MSIKTKNGRLLVTILYLCTSGPLESPSSVYTGPTKGPRFWDTRLLSLHLGPEVVRYDEEPYRSGSGS